MKKQLLFCCLATLGLNAMQAQNFNEWKDPEVNSVNRSAMHTNYFAYASADEAFYDPERALEIQLGEKRVCTSDRFLPD